MLRPLLVALLAGAQDAPASRPEDFRADLDFLATELPKRHKNLFARLAREKWEAEVESLRARLPESDPAASVAGLMRLVASAGDGHTMVAWPAARFRLCPIVFDWLDGGVLVAATRPEHRALLGRRLVAVEGREIEAVAEALRAVLAHDNEAGFRNAAVGFFAVPEILAAAGIGRSVDGVEYAVAGVAGERTADRIASVPRPDAPKEGWEKVSRPTPLCEERPREAFWHRYLEDSGTLYLKYNACRDRAGFEALLERIWGEVEGKALERFVVDLRDNGGGDSAPFRPLLDRLKMDERLAGGGRIFGIVGRHTFSSAVLNALELRQEAKALLAGFPSGGRPNHYGEVKVLELPRTKLSVQYSTKHFRRVEGDPESVPLDLPVATTIADHLAGRDPVLDAILRRETPAR